MKFVNLTKEVDQPSDPMRIYLAQQNIKIVKN